MAEAPADWYTDPLGRHEFRYWDGSQWTAHIADAGNAGLDPLDGPPEATSGEFRDASDTSTAQEDATPTSDEATADAALPGEALAGHAVADEVPPVEPAEDDVVDPYAVSVVEDEPRLVTRPVTRPAADRSGTPSAASAAGQPVNQRSAPAAAAGVRGSLIDGSYAETDTGEHVRLQNAKMLKIELGADVLARQGSMVAFQGAIEFDYEGSGGVGRFIKKAVTGEGVPLMRCRGQGELFLAHDADEVHLLWLDGGGITVNGRNVLAFDPELSWDIERISGAGAFSGGLFNTVLRGRGWVAITTHGTPVVLNTDAPTFADTDAVVAWSSDLHTSLNRTFKTGALVGRGSGEVAQLAFSGHGFVIVQASEGPTVPPHNHGS